MGGFRGAGLVSFDPEAVISKLEVRLRTPTPLPEHNSPWEPRILSNTLEFGYQSSLIRERIQRHADSSPNPVVDALDQLTKGAEMMAYALVLIRKQVAELQAANEAATCCRSYRRKRIQRRRSLKYGEGVQLATQKESNARSGRKKAKKKTHMNDSTQSSRRCGSCSEAGHNTRTCKKDVEITLD